ARLGGTGRIPAKRRSELIMRTLLSLALASVMVSSGAHAAGAGSGSGEAMKRLFPVRPMAELCYFEGDSTPGKPGDTREKAGDPSFSQAKAMIEARNYAGALPLLQQVVARDPRNADAYNLMGYATRKSGNPQGSLQYYTTALQIDPKHLGANEY